MELLMLVGALVVLAVVALGLRRHVLRSAWDRELEQAFGDSDLREVPRHRAL